MVPLHLSAIRRACGLPTRLILSDWLRVTAAAGAMLAVILALRERLDAGLVSAGIALGAGVVAYLLLLELVLLPGHVGRMLVLLRNSSVSSSAATAHKETA
jgi:hypothetical protein